VLIYSCELDINPRTSAVDKYFYLMFHKEVGFQEYKTEFHLQQQLLAFLERYKEVNKVTTLIYRGKSNFRYIAADGKVTKAAIDDRSS
jgi:predicted GNAT family acetyltransferase